MTLDLDSANGIVLQFSPSNWILAVGSIALAATAILALRHLRNSQNRLAVIALESLRLLIAALLIFTLMRPEIVIRLKSTEKPVLMIVHDDSESMETCDSDFHGSVPEKRNQSLKRLLESKFYSPLEETHQIVMRSFGKNPDLSNDGSEIGAALLESLDERLDVKNLILLSDGDWNKGESPLLAAAKLRTKGIQAHCLALGSEIKPQDLIIRNPSPPTYCIPNERVSIPFEVFNKSAETVRAKAKILSAGKVESEIELAIPPFASMQKEIAWSSGKTGKFPLKLLLDAPEWDTKRENNEASFEISVREEKIRVLAVDSLPRWEFRFLRNALLRDPAIELSTLLYLPDGVGKGGGKNYLNAFPQKNDLSRYDVFIVGDIGISENGLSVENADQLAKCVSLLASGIVFMPGVRGGQNSLKNSPLDDLIPVIGDESSPKGFSSPVELKPLLLKDGKDHFLTMLGSSPEENLKIWLDLPGFFWSAAVVRTKPGASVLAAHPEKRNAYGRMPLIVTREHGSGNTLFMASDSTWRWRKGVEDKYQYRFWGQLVRWMAHKRHLATSKGIRLFHTPEKARTGQTVFVSANLCAEDSSPVNGADLALRIKNSKGVETMKIPLLAEDGDWGVYKGRFVPQEGGDFSMELEWKGKGSVLKTEFHVSEDKLEKKDEAANLGLMKKIAETSDGGFAHTKEDFEKILQNIRAAPQEELPSDRIEIWHRWWWGLGPLLST